MEFLDSFAVDEDNKNVGKGKKTCELCEKSISKTNFSKHYKICKKKLEEDIEDMIDDTPVEQNADYNVMDKLTDLAPAPPPEKQNSSIKMFKCYTCGEYFKGKYIYEHAKTVHGKTFTVKKGGESEDRGDNSAPAKKLSKKEEKKNKKQKTTRFFLTISKPLKHYCARVMQNKIPVNYTKIGYRFEKILRTIPRMATYRGYDDDGFGPYHFRCPFQGYRTTFVKSGVDIHAWIVDFKREKTKYTKSGNKILQAPYRVVDPVNWMIEDPTIHDKCYYKGYNYQTKLYARKRRVFKWSMKNIPAMYGKDDHTYKDHNGMECGYVIKWPIWSKYNLEKSFDFKTCRKKTADGKRTLRWIEQMVWNFTEIKRMPRGVVKSIVAANEKGIQMKNRHTHVYVETKKAEVEIKRFRNWFIRRCNKMIDIKTCKKTKMVYCTKEDREAVVVGVDGERLHDDWQMWQAAKAMGPVMNNMEYAFRKWKSKFKVDRFIAFHYKFWNSRAREEIINVCQKGINPMLLKRMSPSKKGLYIYGSPKRGKSNTVYFYTKGNHYEMSHTRSNFPFNSFNGEPYILYEDMRMSSLLSDARLINGLTDDRGFTRGERKGGEMFDIRCKKVIITSNDPPPMEHEWPGFERRFTVLRSEKRAIIALNKTLLTYKFSNCIGAP
jgi:hypothetical protein